MNKTYFDNRNGFTLAEIMVSIAIVAIFSTVSTATFYSYKRTGDLDMAALKLTSDIRKTQGYALGLKEQGGSYPWGIYFEMSNPNRYTIFADSSGNYYYNNGESFLPVSFSDSITISEIRIDGVSRNRVNIVFSAPDPEINMCRNQNRMQCAGSKVEIDLTKGTLTKTVSVNMLGLVEVY